MSLQDEQIPVDPQGEIYVLHFNNSLFLATEDPSSSLIETEQPIIQIENDNLRPDNFHHFAIPAPESPHLSDPVDADRPQNLDRHDGLPTMSMVIEICNKLATDNSQYLVLNTSLILVYRCKGMNNWKTK